MEANRSRRRSPDRGAGAALYRRLHSSHSNAFKFLHFVCLMNVDNTARTGTQSGTNSVCDTVSGCESFLREIQLIENGTRCSIPAAVDPRPGKASPAGSDTCVRWLLLLAWSLPACVHLPPGLAPSGAGPPQKGARRLCCRTRSYTHARAPHRSIKASNRREKPAQGGCVTGEELAGAQLFQMFGPSLVSLRSHGCLTSRSPWREGAV